MLFGALPAAECLLPIGNVLGQWSRSMKLERVNRTDYARMFFAYLMKDLCQSSL